MGHDKSRSSVSVGTVDWNDPNLDALLQKVDGWRLENRSDQPLQEVQIHVSSGWTANSVISKPAQLISMDEQTMVLVTRFPVPQGDHVRVDSQRVDGTHTVWAWMVEGREGYRAGDREHGLFLNRLRIG
ncbi:MAG: hypothetical protein V4566_13835 [Pseudomonadota bacterium]|jgi:hypothetical protein|uniref:hypothetical protein n=1 Tax=Rhodanobacter sp. OK091 TaxID=1881037 RepID=UPI0009181681|nr:hypothetical protein [Rhodanobacter sp. OK091]SHL61624.1 hypothetical protein SAMN05428972_0365 [Rhodanobacter sp. OK091]